MDYRAQALKLLPHVCARCAREFEGKRLRELTVHHKDGDHHNNPPDGSNWEMLCIYCHENEHARYEDSKSGSEPDFRTPRKSGSDPTATHKPLAGLGNLLKKKEMTPAGATFTRCRRWRYLLWRCWDASKPAANFLMLNPSTADEFQLDPSCTRARNYAERWGFGALVVTNIFGWRSTDPAMLKAVKDPVGRGNDAAILKAASDSRIVVCAWGNHGAHMDRGTQVMQMLLQRRVPVHLLKMNSGGHPAHPLYLRATLAPKLFLTKSPEPRARKSL